MRKNECCKLVKVILTLLMTLVTLIPTSNAFAASTPPQNISAPLNYGAANHNGNLVCTISAPEDLRALIDQTDKERGYGMTIFGQVDFKVDNGSWHYTSDWDNPKTYRKFALNYYNSLYGGLDGRYLGSQDISFKTMFPNDTTAPVYKSIGSYEYYKSHTVVSKARFAIDFGGGKIVFSDWSTEYTFTDSSKIDYKKILAEHAPILKSSKLEKNPVNQRPYLRLQLDKHPTETQKLNAAAGNRMWTEVWLRKNGDKEFKKVKSVFFSDEIAYLDVSTYFGNNVQSYDTEGYEVKLRYNMDERVYEQSGVTTMNNLYSPYSNVLTYNMPAWTGASNWASAELQKASDLGLIPDILKGQDMTKNITREEFAEVALLMYEKASEITNTTPVSPNPFNDTANPQILKAYKLGIVKGISVNEFKPMDLINREQVAAMLARTIKLIAPDADYSTTGAPTFTDQSDISDWALNDCLYMGKIGIIKGSDGAFMPRATTEAQMAAGYANTSREQALAMSVRTVGKIDINK